MVVIEKKGGKIIANCPAVWTELWKCSFKQLTSQNQPMTFKTQVLNKYSTLILPLICKTQQSRTHSQSSFALAIWSSHRLPLRDEWLLLPPQEITTLIPARVLWGQRVYSGRSNNTLLSVSVQSSQTQRRSWRLSARLLLCCRHHTEKLWSTSWRT